MSFLLGSNADFLFPVTSAVSVSSVSVLTVQDLTPASLKSGKKEPFTGISGSSLIIEVPTADTSLFQARLIAVTQRLDADLGASDDDYESSVIAEGRSIQESFHILLQKLDSDTGVTDDDYTSILSYTSAYYFSVKFNSLIQKLDSDTHLASEYMDLLISELQTITVNFDKELNYANEIAAFISKAAGSSGNLEVSSKNGFVILSSATKGSESTISIKNTNQYLGFDVTESFGTNHSLLSVSADISVVMVSPTLSAVSVFLDRNVFILNKPYFIVLNDGDSQQIQRIEIVRQNLGSVSMAGL